MFFIGGDTYKDKILWSVTEENRATDHSRVRRERKWEAMTLFSSICKYYEVSLLNQSLK